MSDVVLGDRVTHLVQGSSTEAEGFAKSDPRPVVGIVDFECVSVELDCSVEVALIKLESAKVVRGKVIRADLHRDFELFTGTGPVTELKETPAVGAVADAPFGQHLDDLLEVARRPFVVAPFEVVEPADLVVGQPVLGPGADRPCDCVFGGLRFADRLVRVGEIDVGRLTMWSRDFSLISKGE